MNIEHISLDQLTPYSNNARTHSPEQIFQIANSITEFDFTNPVLIDENNLILAGHGRLMAAQALNRETVPCVRLTHLTETQKRAYILADNRIALGAGWDDDLLRIELDFLKDEDFDLSLTGFDFELKYLFDADSNKQTGAKINGSLAERFIVPPFSILNAREGLWQNRKNAWIALGIKSELGRG